MILDPNSDFVQARRASAPDAPAAEAGRARRPRHPGAPLDGDESASRCGCATCPCRCARGRPSCRSTRSLDARRLQHDAAHGDRHPSAAGSRSSSAFMRSHPDRGPPPAGDAPREPRRGRVEALGVGPAQRDRRHRRRRRMRPSSTSADSPRRPSPVVRPRRARPPVGEPRAAHRPLYRDRRGTQPLHARAGRHRSRSCSPSASSRSPPRAASTACGCCCRPSARRRCTRTRCRSATTSP